MGGVWALLFALSWGPPTALGQDFSHDEILPAPELEKQLREEIRDTDTFYDPKVNYALFTARVTDRDSTSRIFKVFSENPNVKFFRAGDSLEFSLFSQSGGDKCQGFVRNTQGGQYFVMYVPHFYECWGEGEYFRRGALLRAVSQDLARRVREGSEYRKVLLKRRRDFLSQLGGVNDFLWAFDQKKVSLLAEQERDLLRLRRRWEKTMGDFWDKRRDSLRLQKELSQRIGNLDRDLELYRVEKVEPYIDRWSMDHDLGLPMDDRPQKLKAYDSPFKGR